MRWHEHHPFCLESGDGHNILTLLLIDMETGALGLGVPLEYHVVFGGQRASQAGVAGADGNCRHAIER